MVVYSLSLWLNLGLREQSLSVVWFVSSGLYWIVTGEKLVLVFGFGRLLTGLLLWYRLRGIERLAQLSTHTDAEVSP